MEIIIMAKKGNIPWNKDKHHTEETKQKISISNTGKKRTKEQLETLSKSHKGRVAWNKGLSASDETKKKMSISRKKQIRTPETVKKIADKNRGKKRSVEFCVRNAELQRGRKQTPETIAKRVQSQKGKPKKPHSGDSRIGTHRPIEVRKKISDKLSGSNNPKWKGGISNISYCFKFNDIFKEYIRNKFNRTCFICNKHEENNVTKTGKIIKLSIHHVDYDKLDICNGKSWPFVPLCMQCHGKTSNNRWYWFNLLINYWVIDQNKGLNTNLCYGWW
jgi:hypothetical protein